MQTGGDRTFCSPFRSGTLKDACFRILALVGPKGARVQDIVKEIQMQKVAHLAGVTPANTICSALSSAGAVFERVAPGTYALASNISFTSRKSRAAPKRKDREPDEFHYQTDQVVSPSSGSSVPKGMRGGRGPTVMLPSPSASRPSPQPHGSLEYQREGGGGGAGGDGGGSRGAGRRKWSLTPGKRRRSSTTQEYNPKTPALRLSPRRHSLTPNPQGRGSWRQGRGARLSPSDATGVSPGSTHTTPKLNSRKWGDEEDDEDGPLEEPLSQHEACVRVLATVGPEGMTVHEMVNEIKRRRLAKLDGRTPHNSITRCLTADKSFIRIRPGHYALHDSRMEMCAQVLSLFSSPTGESKPSDAEETGSARRRMWAGSPTSGEADDSTSSGHQDQDQDQQDYQDYQEDSEVQRQGKEGWTGGAGNEDSNRFSRNSSGVESMWSASRRQDAATREESQDSQDSPSDMRCSTRARVQRTKNQWQHEEEADKPNDSEDSAHARSVRRGQQEGFRPYNANRRKTKVESPLRGSRQLGRITRSGASSP